jgi:hypothetical protein
MPVLTTQLWQRCLFNFRIANIKRCNGIPVCYVRISLITIWQLLIFYISTLFHFQFCDSQFLLDVLSTSWNFRSRRWWFKSWFSVLWHCVMESCHITTPPHKSYTYFLIALTSKVLRLIMRLKVKVKLSLCFNWAPRHEGVLGSGGTAPRTLWPRQWMEVNSQIHAPAALPPGKEPLVHIG